MLLIRVCQWIKLRIQLITKDPVEVIRAGFRKSDKPSSKIPGIFKGQPYQLSFKLIRSAKRPLMLPSSTLRNLVEQTGGEIRVCRKFRALILETKNPKMKIFRNTMNYPEILRKTD